jgi:hypothetical protein
MKKVLLTGLLLVVCYQCSGMDALGSKKNFDKNEKGSLSNLKLKQATNRPLVDMAAINLLAKMKLEVIKAEENGAIDWIIKNISLIKKMRILTPNEALQLLNALGSREKAEEARKKAEDFLNSNLTINQDSILPQISISTEDATNQYDLLNQEAKNDEETESRLAKVAYNILIAAFDRAIQTIQKKEVDIQALLETLVNKAITEAQQEVKAERKQAAESKESKSTTYKGITLESAAQQSRDDWEQWQQDFLEEQLDQLEQQQATNTQAASSSSTTPTRLPEKLDAIAKGNESKSTTVTMQELVPSNSVETQQSETQTESTTPQATESGLSSITPTRLPEKLDAIAEGNETEDEEQQAEASTTDSLPSPSDTTEVPLESIVIDDFKETVIPIQITSDSESYFGGMPISGQPRLPRVMRDLEEFKFLSFPLTGVETSGQQLGSQRPQTPAQTAQRIRGLLQSNAAKQKTMAEEKKS